MNKKVMYAALAVLLALAVIVALVVFGGDGTKDDSDKNSASSADGSTTESTDGKIDDLEEAPILGNKDDILENRPDNITGSNEETNSKDQAGSSAKPDENSKPSESEPTDAAKPEESPSDVDLVEYEKFLNMTSAEQQKYIESFSSIDAFFDWYNAAKKAYEQANPPIEVGDGAIDIGDIIEDKD